MLGEHSLIILLLKSTIFSLSETRITSLFSLVILRVVFFFFLNQQFITQSVQADCGSNFRNYIHEIRANMTERRKRKRIKKEEKTRIKLIIK